jgi:hypothetical protein
MPFGAELVLVAIWVAPIGYYVWRRQRAEARARGWIVAGEALGLRFERRALPGIGIVFETLTGERSGVRVEVSSSVDVNERSIHARACFDGPALLGMRAATGTVDKHSVLAGPALVEHVPPRWHAHAHDPERAAALLARLQKTLSRYPDNGRELALDDGGVTVSARAEGRRDEVEALLDEAITVHGRVLGAIERLGPSAAQAEAARAWRQVAEREGFALDTLAARLTGSADRFDVRVEVAHSGGLQTVLSFTLRTPAPGCVALSRGNVDPGPFLGLFGDVATPTGDSAFDARFGAHARTPEEAAAVLEPRVREALLDLPIALWGGDISGASLTLRADGVLPGEALSDALRCVDRLARRFARPAEGGYREPA